MDIHIITKVLPWDPYHGKCSIWNEAIVCHSLVFPAALVNEMNPTTSGEQRSIYIKGELWNIISFNVYLCFSAVPGVNMCFVHHTGRPVEFSDGFRSRWGQTERQHFIHLLSLRRVSKMSRHAIVQSLNRTYVKRKLWLNENYLLFLLNLCLCKSSLGQ